MDHGINGTGGGDREQIARFIMDHEDALRRRIGAEVGGSPGVDPDDVFSTTLRRVDSAAAHGSFRMRGPAEAWSFVTKVVQRAVQRHRRRASRMTEALAAFAEISRPQPRAPEPDERAELVAIMQEVRRTRPQDAQLIEHRLRGLKWREISRSMGVSEEALRQRWSSLLARLRERIAARQQPRPQEAPIVTGAGWTRGR